MTGARRVAGAALVAFALVPAGFAGAASDDPFQVQSLQLPGRVVQADLADLDGDGRGDLFCTTLLGVPPEETRALHVYFRRPDATLPAAADWSGPLPPGSGAYDFAEVDDEPGVDLVLLRADRFTVLGFPQRRALRRDLPLPAPSLAVVADEQGLDRLHLVRREFGPHPLLLAPGLAQVSLLDVSGALRGNLATGARANYYLPQRPGPVASENEAELYFDHPRLIAGDVNGDGHGDLVSATRFEVRVFLQQPDGSFASEAAKRIALDRISADDHVRGSGTVRVEGADFDADGRLDLLIHVSTGSFFSSRSELRLHLNRAGSWQIDAPDQVFASEGGASGAMLIDLDGDARVELVEARVPTNLLEVVEVLITRSIDVEVSVYRHALESPATGALFDPRPWHRRQFGLGWNFDTFRPLGFLPTLRADFDGDGMRDLLRSGDGEALEVHLGSVERGFRDRHARQTLDTAGRIDFADANGDGLDDFVLYNPKRIGAPVHVGLNRGTLGAASGVAGNEADLP